MSDTLWTVTEVILRPFILLTMLVFAWWVSKCLYRLIPSGRVKEILYRKRELYTPPGAYVPPLTKWSARAFFGIILLMMGLKAIGLPLYLLWD